MPTFTTADGTITLDLGDDVEVAVEDALMQGGQRMQTGPVTDVRGDENAVWVRGVRVDLAHAHVVRKVANGTNGTA